jgi:hypothetical protein
MSHARRVAAGSGSPDRPPLYIKNPPFISQSKADLAEWSKAMVLSQLNSVRSEAI